MDLKNRVKELRMVKPSELQGNDQNWRVHPKLQREALQQVVEQVGITDVLKAYHSERQGGLTLVDGHLRQDMYPGVEWPVLILDLNDEEADLILTSGDAIASLASASAEKLVELRKSVGAQSGALGDVLDGLASKAAVALANIPAPQPGKPVKPMVIPPSVVAAPTQTATEISREVIELHEEEVQQRPDFTGIVEEFKPPETGKTEKDEKWFYIDFYGDEKRWSELLEILEPHTLGSYHHLNPDVFYQAIMAFLSS